MEKRGLGLGTKGGSRCMEVLKYSVDNKKGGSEFVVGR